MPPARARRVLAVNLRSGGSRDTIGPLVERARSWHPSIVVLSEYRDNRLAPTLKRALSESDFHHIYATDGYAGNGVLVASSEAFVGRVNPFGLFDDEYPNCNPGRVEFSWYPFRRDPEYTSASGWRIDKAFVSNALLPRVAAAYYDHEFRTLRLTDHSALIVDLWKDGDV